MRRLRINKTTSKRLFKKTFSTSKKLNSVLSNRGGIRL